MKKRTSVSLVLALTLVLFAIPANAAEVPPVGGEQTFVVPASEDGEIVAVITFGEEQKETRNEVMSRAAVPPALTRGMQYASKNVRVELRYKSNGQTFYPGYFNGTLYYYYDSVNYISGVTDLIAGMPEVTGGGVDVRYGVQEASYGERYGYLLIYYGATFPAQVHLRVNHVGDMLPLEYYY